MLQHTILISGPVASGKSSVADSIDRLYPNVRIVRTRDIIREHAKSNDRDILQAYGDRLDKTLGGEWIASRIFHDTSAKIVVVDAIRTLEQITAIRSNNGSAQITHIHLEATNRELQRRYTTRNGDIPYETMKTHETELAVDGLRRVADLTINTESTDPVSIAREIMGYLDPIAKQRFVDVMIGGQYGSEGKGHICSYIANEYDVLIRGGGPNAGHTVWADPEPIVFHHLPSGSFHNPKAVLCLAPGAVINVDTLLHELRHLTFDYRLWIDPRAMLIEQRHVDVEAELVKGIGSTGQGVGAATADKIMGRADYAKDELPRNIRLAKDDPRLTQYLHPTEDILEGAYELGQRVLVEGTQGTGLSLHHGPYPHVTSRDTSVNGILSEVGIAPHHIDKIYMTSRSFPIRVQSPDGGTSGPMKEETTYEAIANQSGLDVATIKKTEITSTTKRQRRMAEFDFGLLWRSVRLNGPTDICLTFADYIDKANMRAKCFDDLTPATQDFIHRIERLIHLPVSLISVMFHPEGIIDRR